MQIIMTATHFPFLENVVPTFTYTNTLSLKWTHGVGPTSKILKNMTHTHTLYTWIILIARI